MRRIFVFAFILCIVFAALCACDNATPKNADMAVATETPSTTDESTEILLPPAHMLILDECREIVNYLLTDESARLDFYEFGIVSGRMPKTGKLPDYRAEGVLWSWHQFNRSEELTRESIGYALKDLNEDGTPELIFFASDYKVLAIFYVDIDNNARDFCYEGCSIKNQFYINDDGTIFRINTQAGASHSIIRISDFGQLICIEGIWHDSGKYYRGIGDETSVITEDEYDELLKLYELDNATTKNSDIRFIPLFD